MVFCCDPSSASPLARIYEHCACSSFDRIEQEVTSAERLKSVDRSAFTSFQAATILMHNSFAIGLNGTIIIFVYSRKPDVKPHQDT